MLFPELLIANLADPDFDPYVHVAVIRRHLCRAAASSEIACDPVICRAGLAHIGRNGLGGTVNACKRLWRDYYDGAFLPKVAGDTSVFDDVLADLGYGIGME